MMTDFFAFQVHGHADDQSMADFVGTFLAFLESLLSKSAGEIFATLIPGIAAMDNIHPVLVHFPIAFLTAFVVLDFLGSCFKKPQWREFAGGLLYLGTVSAVFTVVAGFVAANSVAHDESVHALMEQHETFGLTVLCLAAVLSGWRLKSGHQIRAQMNVLYLMLSALLAVCLMLGADLGGLMVYQYGVAVKATPIFAESPHDHHEHSH